MTRVVLSEVLLFLLPFALFAAFLVLSRRNPFLRAAWSGHVGWLAFVGLGLAIASLVVLGLTVERQQGAFVPTHVENGRVVPGQFR